MHVVINATTVITFTVVLISVNVLSYPKQSTHISKLKV